MKSVIEGIKAIKNKVEMEGMRASNIRDNAAIVKYYAWLEDQLKNNPDKVITEYDGAQKVLEFREEN